MSDLSQLVSQLVQFLAPFLPYLVKAGEKASEEAGKKLGADAWERAKALWGKLERKERVQKAAEAAAALPDNSAMQQAVETEVARALQEDPALCREIARLWGEAKAAGATVIAAGERSVAIGGSVSGSVIVTGDRNRVQSGVPPAASQSTGKRRGIAMIPVESSMIDSVGYDEETHCLQVVFNTGKVYCYEDVPPEVFQGLLAAESKGQYMRACIIDVDPHHRGPCFRQ